MELELLQQAVADVLKVDPAEVKPESTFVGDLGADSLDLLQIVMAMEEKLDIELPAEAADQIKTVADALAVIRATR